MHRTGAFFYTYRHGFQMETNILARTDQNRIAPRQGIGDATAYFRRKPDAFLPQACLAGKTDSSEPSELEFRRNVEPLFTGR